MKVITYSNLPTLVKRLEGVQYVCGADVQRTESGTTFSYCIAFYLNNRFNLQQNGQIYDLLFVPDSVIEERMNELSAHFGCVVIYEPA